MPTASVGACLRVTDLNNESASAEEVDRKGRNATEIHNDTMCRICLILILGLEGGQASGLL